ncbi:hypothetical protein AJ78_07820 [Emergomyces pasteurianus Ep9510]|uniref:HNH nuclease domain-containing protein n=1 Tax=Emergomyces pasteurianus Ep9510 TaxID=1447872 RepID=A0A1J9P699_9EURO|nr:hypothetical protein AJ78_07820 [Emergomyces pasteurianus Ep9510]
MADAEFVSSTREDLINKISDAVNGNIHQNLWPFLWLADISQLEEICRNPDISTYLVGLTTRINDSKLLPKWTQRARDRTPSLTSSPEPSITNLSAIAVGDIPVSTTSNPRSGPKAQSKKSVEMCRMRDENRCVITGADDPVDVAHIFPFSMRELQSPDLVNDIYNPWSVLRMFWTKERVDAWYDAITSPLATESVRNLMCFAPSVHKYHERAYFALEPVEEDSESNTLTVRFHWLPHMTTLHYLKVNTHPSFPPGIGCGRRIRLWNVKSSEEIVSGTLIRITAHEGIPLPDPALLELQWILHRIIALAGGAEAVDISYNDDDDDYDEPYPEFDDVDMDFDLQLPPTSFSQEQFSGRTQHCEPGLTLPVR